MPEEEMSDASSAESSPPTAAEEPSTPLSSTSGDVGSESPAEASVGPTALDGQRLLKALGEHTLQCFILFARPLLALAETDEELETYLHVAALLWNLELFPEEGRGEAEDAIAGLLCGGVKNPKSYADALNLIQEMRRWRDQVDPDRRPFGIGRCSIRRGKKRKWVISAQIVPISLEEPLEMEPAEGEAFDSLPTEAPGRAALPADPAGTDRPSGGPLRPP